MYNKLNGSLTRSLSFAKAHKGTENTRSKERKKSTALDDGFTQNVFLLFSVNLCVSVAEISFSDFLRASVSSVRDGLWRFVVF
jgi:hypothetical protein